MEGEAVSMDGPAIEYIDGVQTRAALEEMARELGLSEGDFRAAGMTLNALLYPLSDAAFDWLCKFNGTTSERAPRVWRYAPNAYMRHYLDQRVAAPRLRDEALEGPLSTAIGQGTPPEINDGLGTVAQQSRRIISTYQPLADALAGTDRETDKPRDAEVTHKPLSTGAP